MLIVQSKVYQKWHCYRFVQCNPRPLAYLNTLKITPGFYFSNHFFSQMQRSFAGKYDSIREYDWWHNS